MAWPFTPLVTHSDNTVPKVTADELNQLQAGVNAAARPVYAHRPDVRMTSTDGEHVFIFYAPTMVLDSATSKYVYVEPADITTISHASFLPSAGAWPTDSWVNVFLRSVNGVPVIETRVDGAVAFPFSDGAPYNLFGQDHSPVSGEMQRYLGSFVTAGSSILPFYMAGRKYRYYEPPTIANVPGSTSWTSASSVYLGNAKFTNLGVFLAGDGSHANLVNLRPVSSSFSGISVAPVGALAQQTGQSIDVPGSAFEWSTSHASGTVIIKLYGREE